MIGIRGLNIKLHLVLLLLISAVSVVHAQIGITIKSEHSSYLRYEPVKVIVTVRNYSGNVLAFGEDNSKNRLDFIVEREEGERIPKQKKKPSLVKDLILGAGETKQLLITLNNLYDMQKEGAYTVYATLGHQRLDYDYRSEPITLQVTGGLVIWNRKLGIPASDSGRMIQAREASLLITHQDVGELYCLRIEDKKLVYSVVRLGPKIAGAEPECDVDGVSNIHLLYLIQPRLYAYRIYDFKGRLRQEKFYVPEEGIPHLLRDPDVGRIMVYGGKEAVEGVDFQAVKQKNSAKKPRDVLGSIE